MGKEILFDMAAIMSEFDQAELFSLGRTLLKRFTKASNIIEW